ncbi:hypothetical protein CEXT_684211 [Caerostris extrusa]|uniref:Uncharacterized protein n=1 Tax=Caerostris extrusa TaxID=172846 RepID=A0AAV4T3W0_CAEEX|nr:hypothetical protein CEXT_684211 [Caerostris extrusa]
MYLLVEHTTCKYEDVMKKDDEESSPGQQHTFIAGLVCRSVGKNEIPQADSNAFVYIMECSLCIEIECSLNIEFE